MSAPLITGLAPNPAEAQAAGAVAKTPDRPPAKTIVYACSGCSDAGELADRVARALSRSGAAEMSCLAGIGGRVTSIMARGEKAERILVIDGCPLNCARRTLELARMKSFAHLGINELGMRKGTCPVTEERIALGVETAKRALAQPEP